MMAAVTAAEAGASVLLMEQNQRLGRKMGITGKGRCNVTNNCTPEEFLRHVLRGNKFLYGAAYRFTPEDAMRFFTDSGIELKTERGRRVFPSSDRAADVVSAMERRLRQSGVTVEHCRVTDIVLEGGEAEAVRVGDKIYPASAVIIATGGVSYPATGSRGDGHRMAKRAGLQVTELCGSLVPIETRENTAPLSGLTLKNVTLTASLGGKTVYSEMGEMLFAHFGITGPLVLSASANMQGHDITEYKITVDLKPAIPADELDARLVRILTEGGGKDIINAMAGLLPASLIGYVLDAAGIDRRAKAYSIDKKTRRRLLDTLKNLTFTPVALRPMEEAIVTCGGVATNQINPKTMMAKNVPGLYFAGEVLDCDAYTGGYNLQIAYSTGYAAGLAAAARANEMSAGCE